MHLVLSTTIFWGVSSVLSPGRILYSKALPFESPSHFSLKPTFKRHFPSHLFFLSKVLSSSFSSAHFLAEHSFGGRFFLELSVAMAKCSSQPCFSMDKPSWALWVEAGKQLRAKSWYLSIRKVASYWFNPSGKHGFGSVLFSFCSLCWKSIHINYLYWIHRYQ